MVSETIRQAHHDGKNHGGSADYGGADQHRLGGRLECVASAVIFFQQVFGACKLHVEAEVLLDSRGDVGHLLNQRQFID